MIKINEKREKMVDEGNRIKNARKNKAVNE
jgi:hypothetical protein